MKTYQHFNLDTLGLKKTTGRYEMLQFLCGQDKPVDVGEILEYFKTKHISINQATVYRILDTFNEKGILQKLEFHEGKYRYELNNKVDHHHLTCLNCRSIQDISSCIPTSIEDKIRKQTGAIIKSHTLEFFGICKKCQQ